MGLISLILKNKNFMAKKINSKGAVRNCGFLPVIMCEITLLCICNPNTNKPSSKKLLTNIVNCATRIFDYAIENEVSQ